MGKTSPKIIARQTRVSRIRKKISGTPERPRLQVFKSLKHIYAQIINDETGHTLVSMSSLSKILRGQAAEGKTGRARQVGLALAEAAKARGIEKVVFDRSGYLYHGRVKALSEGAREGGLVF
ncbi:MAG: 50S ribosomal protein L18 [Thermodesulfobacteriota bacterium]